MVNLHSSPPKTASLLSCHSLSHWGHLAYLIECGSVNKLESAAPGKLQSVRRSCAAAKPARQPSPMTSIRRISQNKYFISKYWARINAVAIFERLALHGVVTPCELLQAITCGWHQMCQVSSWLWNNEVSRVQGASKQSPHPNIYVHKHIRETVG